MSVLVGGGYATGREFVAFFLSYGPLEGLAGLLLAMALLSIIFAASLEFARLHNAFEYRSFFRALLGRFWILFEITYLLMMLLVLSVLGATSGALAQETLGWPPLAGTLGFMAITALLACFGSKGLEAYLVSGAVALYVFFAIFLFLCLFAFGDAALARLAADDLSGLGPALWGGLKYTGYNVSVMTGALFCAVHLTRPRDALVSGMIAGPLALLPGLLFYVAMVAFHPQILEIPVPMNHLINALDIPLFGVPFILVLFSTLVATGAALIHALNERLAGADPDRRLSGAKRGGVALAAMLISSIAAERVGLIKLVEQGYGMITFAFIALYVVPILLFGLHRLLRRNAAASGDPELAAGR